MADEAKTKSTQEGAWSEKPAPSVKGTKPIPAREMGRSPMEIREGGFPYDDKAFDPEEQPVAAEDAGAIGYAGSSQASFNDPYIDGGGIYSRPVRKD